MPNKPIHPGGSTLGYDPAGGTNYTAITYLQKMSWAGIDYKDVDITHLLSTNKMREFMAGFGNAGEITAQCIFEQSQYTTDMSNRRTTMTWKWQLPTIGSQTTGASVTFSGYFKRVGGLEGAEVDGQEVYVSQRTVKITGDVTFNAGS